MELTVDNLRDTFKVGYELSEPSRLESRRIWNLYHNKQYTQEQLAILTSRGQPPETFNIVKKFSRMLLGYYSTVVNTMIANPATVSDVDAAALMTDTIQSVLRENNFDVEGDKIKLGGLISGLFSSVCVPYDTGVTDEFGRKIYKIRMHYVPDNQLVLDASSTMDDYSDAGYIHRFKWLNPMQVKKLVGDKLHLLEENHNFLNIPEADRYYNYGVPFTGTYRVNDSYLIVHTVWTDDNEDRWSVYWSGEHILRKEKITYRAVKWPYRIQKLHDSDGHEYYGIFREVEQAQHAINQAVLKIQLMVNSQKAFVEDGAVEDLDEFTRSFNRVTGVIPVLKIKGIKLDHMTAEVQQQYVIIDRALDRVQQVLGINDSFLGMAFASDSGRKVKLQQNATIMSLRYVTTRLQSFYTLLGRDVSGLIKQFYRAHQILRVSDEVNGQRFVELNKPMTMPTGVDPTAGTLIEEPIFVPVYNPDTLEPEIDAEGNFVMAPVNEPDTELAFNSYEMDVEARSYNDEDEKAQLLLETMVSGQIGAMMSKVNPAGFFKLSSLVVRLTKTRFSNEIAQVIEETSAALGGDPAAQEEAKMAAIGGGGSQPNAPMSKALKLPQNTNEGAG